jgi:hypothetical protein
MKINWSQNPLHTKVELDESDRERILLYLQNELHTDLLCDLNMRLEGKLGQKVPITVDEIRAKVSGWGNICDMTIEHEDVKAYEGYLQESHGGDCTCWAASCMKCHAEGALGINTIKGLGKHSANKIMGAFSGGKTIDEAITTLEQKPSYEKPKDWPDVVGYEKHIPRWEAEREAAIKWLKIYKEDHGF